MPILEDPTEAVTRVAQPWILYCQNYHVACHQNEHVNLPTRVLDVNGSGDSVILRNSKDLSGRYTVLSHCWGTERALTTTFTRIEQHMTGIPDSGLPATFQDAVKITRMLGIQYLWIDSLCIIQDQLSDWEHESAKMHEYYQNAFVTIAALDSKDSFAGILHQREALSVELAGHGNLFLRAKIPTARSIYENSILESRAWCLQERLLSTRVIHVAKSELLFECRTGNRRESSFSFGSVSSTENFYRFGPDRLKRVLDALKVDPESAKEAIEFWYKLVKQYSRRTLTNPKDMLQAILGVAEHIKSVTGLTYMYGLWEEDLARGLLWTNDWRNHSRASEGKRQQSGAPSWSWAAMTGYIKYWPNIQQSLLRSNKLNWSVARTSDQELILQCRCFYVYLQKSERPISFMTSVQSWDTAKIFHVYYNESHSGRKYSDRDHGARVGWMIADAEIQASDINQCKAVEIVGAGRKFPSGIIVRAKKDATEVSRVVWFLIVVPHPDAVGCWKRVGAGMSGDVNYHFETTYDIADLAEAIKPELVFEGVEIESICLR
ncbi:hypothetical protein IFR04_005657 [Cadophora malorum]|uniref:Heterokaryon incompatibility domain-containing protein n=1 Tax=Cadophora malorum TaxID=108018 RepID=A0A8H7TKV1_9HELO|nr:hypothetical protein IFR04_005657 [Cadophora malorum]